MPGSHTLGVIYYALTNGKTLGIWGDYTACTNGDTYMGSYVFVHVEGNYQGDLDLNRGGIGKFTNGYSSRTGLCVPSICANDKDLEPLKASFVEQAL